MFKYYCTKATCALPLVSPLVELYNGYYLDGGISDPIPYKKALEDGCDKLTVVLTQHRGYIKNKQSNLGFIKFFYRKYPKIYEALKVRHEVYNKQIEEIRELEKKGIVKIICPNEPVGIKRIERDFEKIKNLYNKGYRDGMNY